MNSAGKKKSDLNLKIIMSSKNDNYFISKARANTRKINESEFIVREVTKNPFWGDDFHLIHLHFFLKQGFYYG